MTASNATLKKTKEPQLTITALAVRLAVATALLPVMSAHAQEASQNNAVTLPKVTVSPETDNTTTLGSVTVISSDQMQKNGTNDMAGIVKYQPLISAPSIISGTANVWDGTGTSSYNIRGVEGNRIGLDVDGIELPSATPLPDSMKANGFGIGRDYIDPEIFREVNISSGTTSAGTGGATGIGGRVSFITKSPEDYLQGDKTSYLNYKLGYSSADRSWNNVLTGAQTIGDWKVLGLYSRRDGHQADSRGNAATDKNEWHSNALLTKLVYEGFTHHKIGLTLDLYQRKDERQLGKDTVSGMISYPDGADQTSKTHRYRIMLEDEFSTGADSNILFDHLKTYVYYQDSKKSDYTMAARPAMGYIRHLDTYLSTKSTGIGADASKTAGIHHLYYGLSVNYLQEERPWSEHRYTLAGAYSNYSREYDRMAPTDTTKVVAYIRDQAKVTDRLTVTPGIRGEYWHTSPQDLSHYLANPATSGLQNQIKSKDKSFLAPSLNFSYALTPTYNAYIQYSRGVRIPTAAEKTGVFDANSSFGYVIVGNQNLKEETSNAFELGTKGEIARGVTLNSSLFYTKYKNFIDYTDYAYPGFSNAYQLQNIAKVNIWGGEISTHIKLGEFASAMKGFSVMLAAGISHGSSKNNEGNKGDVNSVAPAKASFSLAYDDPSEKFGGAITTTLVKHKQSSDNDVSANGADEPYFRVPGYTTVDLTTYWNVTKNVTINAGLFNLTNKKYWDYAGARSLTTNQTGFIERAAQPGRNVGVSANITF